ncbi:acyl-homoserine-lactone synthase [Mesorhizobium xinjiangense]|uniref:acyl-homoserine-lactone synthase n=1 Tax=Mesorhizobium xinjiangense TaxID=2678685 RepID=UPI0012ED9AB6|nr:acyl-homoserine-lactone synthase [Mesorhizobium xinjiangense]
MIEGHVVQPGNRHLYEAEFEEFLRRRHDYFVKQKRWLPESPDGREVDQFDTDSATYILGIEEGQVVTSCRLIPTSEPHLVSEVFPHFCEARGVPRRADWAEWTRTFVATAQRGMTRRGTLTQLCCAVMEYALDEGLSAVGGIQETYFLSQHKMLNWRVRPMGLSREVNGEWCIVAYIDVDDAALANARRVLGIDRSLLVRRGVQRRFLGTACSLGRR